MLMSEKYSLEIKKTEKAEPHLKIIFLIVMAEDSEILAKFFQNQYERVREERR